MPSKTEVNCAKAPRVVVGMGTCGLAAGAEKVRRAFCGEIKRRDLAVEVLSTGCAGMCYNEVLTDVLLPGQPRVVYGRVTPEIVPKIVEEHLIHGCPVQDFAVGYEGGDPSPWEGIPSLDRVPFYSGQKKLVTKNCGYIDPDSIEAYINSGGYSALKMVLRELAPEEVIKRIKASGLRGRGGGGFPTGVKWEAARQATGGVKYVICNADEGDPGAFMDRSVLEGDPHAVLEGMIIAGYAIGAALGYIYIRAEYPLAVNRLIYSLAQAKAGGFLGENILDSGFDFDIKIKQGAGAFVCGEETALMASIEGDRGMPRPRPPFPAARGLWGMPTSINNVETFANIPVILNMGADSYARIGTEHSKGTKVFALTGKVNRSGLVEVPMGVTLREIVYDTGGGIKDGKKFKAAQIGGPAGGCLPEALLDLPVDYDSLLQAGAIMGSGGLVVMDEDTCMVEIARYFLAFTSKESCGKCTPGREGTWRLLEIVDRIVEGKGAPGDLDLLESLSKNIKNTALCGLCQAAPNPVLSTLKYFRREYELHIEKKYCPAGVCRNLTSYRITAEHCNGCGRCVRHCPAGAISGAKKEPHAINPEKCAKCGVCLEKCTFGAIVRGGEA